MGGPSGPWDRLAVLGTVWSSLGPSGPPWDLFLFSLFFAASVALGSQLECLRHGRHGSLLDFLCVPDRLRINLRCLRLKALMSFNLLYLWSEPGWGLSAFVLESASGWGFAAILIF